MLIHNADITGSLTINGVPYNTGSFSGSFFGDGSQLSGVTSYTNADTLAFIQGYSGSYSGSFSGSFFGDGSNLSGVTSYTDADTLDFINSLNVVSGSIQTVSTVSDTFTSATSYTVTHNFGTKEVIVSVYENDTLIFPSSINTPTTNTVTITFPEPVTGRAVVVKAGHIVSGSINYNSVLNKPTLVSGSSQITYSGLTGIPSGIVSGSSQISFNGITNKPTLISGSSQIAALGYATTGSNIFQGNQTITGSLFITQNLVVAGSSSIQYISSSVLDIANNTITVNVLNPSVRFGGLAVIDSGSSPQRSGSMLFDSIKDEWIFVHQNQSNITSSVVLMGPETYNNLGNETYLSANRLPKGSGVEHLRDSNITDTGTVVSINSNTRVTGSLGVTGSLTVNGAVYAGGATSASALTGASELIVQNEIGIQSADSTGPYLRMVAGNVNQNFTLVTGAASGSEPNLLFNVGGSTRLTLNASTGAATLTGALNGTSATFTNSITSNYTYNGGGVGMLHLTSNGTEGGSITFEKTSGTTQKYKIGNSGAAFFVYDETGAKQPFTILNNGNVGIGSATSPVAALNVSNVPTSYFGIIETTGTSAGTVKHFRVHKPFYVEYGIGILADNSFHISTASTFPTTNGFTITSTGNVGMGTDNPLTRLDCQTANTGTVLVTAAFRDSSTNGNALQIWNGNNEARFRAVYYGAVASDQNITFYTIQSSGVEAERMRINSAGLVTKPFQTSFKAGRNSSYFPGANSNIIFNDTSSANFHFNIGNNYNTSNGVYTAPVAGRYVFTTCVIYEGVSEGQAMDDAFEIYINNVSAIYSFRRAEYVAGTTGNGGYYTDHATVIFNLSAGDFVTVRNQRNIMIHGNSKYCWFTGYLLG